MKRRLHRVNLKLDSPPGRSNKDKKGHFPLLRTLLVLFLLVLLFAAYKMYKSYMTLTEVRLKVSYHPTTKVHKPVVTPPTPAPEKIAQKIEGQKKREAGAKVSLKEKKEEVKGTKIQEKLAPSEDMQVALTSFPPTKLKRIKTLLEEKGIKGKKEERKIPCAIYRVAVGGVKNPKELDRVKRRLKRVMPNVSPWKLKENELYYLNVASFRNMREAQITEKKLESLGFQVDIKKAKIALKTPVLTFKVKREKWEKLKKELPPQKVQILEELLLSHRRDLSQPTSTTSQGKGSP